MTTCRAVALQCLQRCPTNNNKFTFTAENHTYNFLVDGGFSFLVVADDKLVPPPWNVAHRYLLMGAVSCKSVRILVC